MKPKFLKVLALVLPVAVAAVFESAPIQAVSANQNFSEDTSYVINLQSEDFHYVLENPVSDTVELKLTLQYCEINPPTNAWGSAIMIENNTTATLNVRIVFVGGCTIISGANYFAPIECTGTGLTNITFALSEGDICDVGYPITFGYQNNSSGTYDEKIVHMNNPAGTISLDGCTFIADNEEYNKFINEYIGVGKSKVFTFKKKHVYTSEDLIDSEPSTCTSAGYDIYYCEKCEQQITVEKELAPHTFVDGEIQEATCATPEKRYCSECEEWIVNDEHPALGHNWATDTITEPATCCEEGIASGHCSRCSQKTTRIKVPIDPNGHDLEFVETTTDPTCIDKGLDLYRCNYCQEEIEIETDSLGRESHDWGEWELEFAPICCEDGLETRTCSYCEATENREVPSTGTEHVLEDRTIEEEPTCTEPGYASGFCIYCNEDITEEIPPTGHRTSLDLPIVSEVAPTCTEKGYNIVQCIDCGENFIDTNSYVDPLEHEWGEWIQTSDAVCGNDGEMYRQCTVCGEIETQTILADDHVWELAEEVPSTCITPGYELYKCRICGTEWVEELDIDNTNHEGKLVLVIDVPATTETEGSGRLVWDCCGEEEKIPSKIVIPVLTEDNAKEVVGSIIGVSSDEKPEEEKTDVEKAIDNISTEKLLDVAQEVNKTYEQIAGLEDVSDETKFGYIQSIGAATEGAVIAGSKLENSSQEAASINGKMPENSPIKMDEKLEKFYKLQYDLILGKIADPEKSTPRMAVSKADNAGSNGIDYTESADVYKQVGDFIDNTVEHMAGAASMIRVCSNEKITSMVNDYIDTIGVKSFRSFDKQAADLEFANNAYKAILINIQNQTIVNLNEEFEEMSKSLSGVALSDLENQYNEQLAICNDLDTFEWTVIEIMRQKYDSILNQYLIDENITYEEYKTLFIGNSDSDLEKFKEIYLNIFYSWALGDDAQSYGYDNIYGITLQELTDAAITSTSLQQKKTNASKGATPSEITVAIIFGSLSLATAGALIWVEILKRRRGA